MDLDNLNILYKVDHVSKIFSKKYILNDISFTIKSRNIFGIIGSSGSGKTTLLNLLIGYLKPDKGEVYYKDLHLVDVNNPEAFLSVKKHLNELKKFYGFAAQKPSFYPTLTVNENLRYFGALYNLSRESIKLNTNNRTAPIL